MRPLTWGLGLAIALLGAMAPAQQNPTAKSGKYVVELRVPEEGVFAQEETDIEFRLMDSTQNDAILGMSGVPNAKVEAIQTMPEMPGMPEARPPIHTEGVPGDYGVTFFFPHGGKYQVDLKITPPGDAPFKATFLLDVKDERSVKGKPKAKPYRLDVVSPNGAEAGKPFTLTLRVVDTKSKEVVKAFDIAHERNFHLLLASKDFEWFLHEHPEMQSDGTWKVDVTFPTGGEYFVYGDVAPAGKGSMILANSVKVSGPKPTWKVDWTPNLGPAEDGPLVGRLGGQIAVGAMTSLEIKLTDKATGQPVTDLQPYLGAAGHLMIFSEDGQTTVHSHPAEDAATKQLAGQGTVRFNARFPKAGKYRAFAQFQRGDKVYTLKFTVEVK